MTDYTACGLRLQSALPLPGLRPAEAAGTPDVVVRRGPVPEPDGYPASGIAVRPGPETDVLAWYGRARLRLSAEAVDVETENDPFAAQCVVGPGLGVVLHRRGRVVLHGSAVDVGGRAVVLVGDKGAGKSTTAAALLARGHALLTDDLVALAGPSAAPTVLPGPAQMKLWPASAEAFGIEVAPFLDGLAKGVWHGAPTAPEAAPVGLVCVLAWGDALRLDPLAGADAFGAVAAHAYAPRFLGAPAAAALVRPLAALAGAVPVARLTRPLRLDEAVRAAERLEAAAGA